MTHGGAATPLCPSGFASTSVGGLAEVPHEPATCQAARLGAPPCSWPRGTTYAARPIAGKGS
jgi:hypothetical protein